MCQDQNMHTHSGASSSFKGGRDKDRGRGTLLPPLALLNCCTGPPSFDAAGTTTISTIFTSTQGQVVCNPVFTSAQGQAEPGQVATGSWPGCQLPAPLPSQPRPLMHSRGRRSVEQQSPASPMGTTNTTATTFTIWGFYCANIC
eukprot:156081-Amphidinium_carterae.1